MMQIHSSVCRETSYSLDVKSNLFLMSKLKLRFQCKDDCKVQLRFCEIFNHAFILLPYSIT